jgi:hypothetical protein
MNGMGHVYVLSTPEGYYKIGSTSGLIDDRVKQFAIALPFKVEIMIRLMCAPGNERQAERLIHEHFATKRTNGEWFKLTEEDLQWFYQNPLALPLAVSHEHCYAQECLGWHNDEHLLLDMLGLS